MLSRISKVLLLLLLIMLSVSCSNDSSKIHAIWRGTQASVADNSESSLSKFSIFRFYDNNKVDLGKYDYTSDDFLNNFIWDEIGIEYEWVDENKIDIKYKGSNIFEVKIQGDKLVLDSESYSIEFEKVISVDSK